MLEIAASRGAGRRVHRGRLLRTSRSRTARGRRARVHALLFADDRVAALREWRRVTRARRPDVALRAGTRRLVPSASSATSTTDTASPGATPTTRSRPSWRAGRVEAGWADVETDADPSTGIPLADEATFRTWLRVGPHRRTTSDWPTDRRRAVRARPDGRRARATPTARSGSRSARCYLTAANR